MDNNLVLDNTGLVVQNGSELDDKLAGSISGISKSLQQISNFMNKVNGNEEEEANGEGDAEKDAEEDFDAKTSSINIEFEGKTLDIVSNTQMTIASVRNK